jgi:hypothetical protein
MREANGDEVVVVDLIEIEAIRGIPLWLLLFVVAGFLLFCFKIAGGAGETEKRPKLRVFSCLRRCSSRWPVSRILSHG